MAYKGFTLSLTAGEVQQLSDLLARIVAEKQMFKVDRHIASFHVERFERWLEVTPDGATPTHGTADA